MEPTTFHSAVKGSTNLAKPAAVKREKNLIMHGFGSRFDE